MSSRAPSRTLVFGLAGLTVVPLALVPAALEADTAAPVSAPPGGPVVDPVTISPVPAQLDSERSQPELAALVAVARRVTVRVGDRSGASGSGTIVSREGHVLTALHVVAGVSGRVLVTTPDGIAHRARVLRRDEAHDLALLGLDTTTPHCVPDSVGDPRDPWVLAAGFAGALEGLHAPSITVGTRLGPEPLPTGSVAPRELASVHVAPGMSGGPVLDARGALVGIVVAMGRYGSLAGLGDASPLSGVSCDAPTLAPSLPAVVENEHHEPDRDASLAASRARASIALASRCRSSSSRPMVSSRSFASPVSRSRRSPSKQDVLARVWASCCVAR